MKLYYPTAHGFDGAEANQLRAKCPLCGRLYPFDIASYLLNGGTLDGGPADDPWCPDCVTQRDLNSNKE